MRSTPRQDDPACAADADTNEKFGLLIVDDEPEIRQVIDRALAGDQLAIHTAGNLTEARTALGKQAIDVVLLDIGLPDGDGLTFADELHRDHPNIRTIMVTANATTQTAVQAMRAGVVDFIAKPLNIDELTQRVTTALHTPRAPKQDPQVERLKRLCRKLNHSRHDITQQVDILCNDLVTAYQELASQMHHVETTTELRSLLKDELDLEQLLRRLMEFLLDKVGPTNVVVFLPSQDNGHTVGGYVNYSCDKDSSQVLLSHLADVAAPRIAEEPQVMWLTDDHMISAWLGDDAAWLADMQVLTTGCRDGEDVLAAIMLFRDTAEPFADADYELLEAIAPLFGHHLVKVINVHHRRKELFGDDEEDDGYGWGSDDDEGGLAA